MSGGLVIRLRPYEKFLLNGAVVENGEKRAKLCIKSRDANILRLRDALHPNDVTTPVKRLYYTAQLAVTGDMDVTDAMTELMPGLQALLEALPDQTIQTHIANAIDRTQGGEFYCAMRELRKVFPYEEKLLLIAKAKELALANEKAQ